MRLSFSYSLVSPPKLPIPVTVEQLENAPVWTPAELFDANTLTSLPQQPYYCEVSDPLLSACERLSSWAWLWWLCMLNSFGLSTFTTCFVLSWEFTILCVVFSHLFFCIYSFAKFCGNGSALVTSRSHFRKCSACWRSLIILKGTLCERHDVCFSTHIYVYIANDWA